MVRLPVPGSDLNQWGVILNDFLSVEHNSDGTQKSNSINSSQLAPASVTNPILADNAVTNAKLDTATQSIISSVASKYVKPAAGIPAGDLDSAVQASLGKADSALQTAPVTSVNSKTGAVTLTAADVGAPTVLSALNDVNTSGATTNQVLSFDSATGKWSASTVTTTTVSDASTTTKGIIQLAGDLGGTAASPTVPGLASKESTITAGTTAQYYRGDKSWQTLDKATIGLSNVDNTSDASKPVSTAQQSALDLKANLVSPSFTGAVTVPDPTNTTDAATKAYVDNAASSAVTAATTPDATTTVKGKIQLTGDLSGTAASPTVPGLAGKESTITAGTTAQYYRGDKSWQTLDKTAVGLSSVDNTTDINKPISTATQTALSSEVTNRTNADTTLQNNINAEATARANADSSIMPAGSIIVTAGSTAPTGWLLCNGALVSRSTYATLFATIGTTYGAGDGSTTFGLPNLLGKVIAGVDAAQTEFNTLGKTGGEKTHILLTAEMPSHNHIQDAHNHTQNAHGHNVSDPGHNHSQNAHSHSVTSPGSVAGPGGQIWGDYTGAGGTTVAHTVQDVNLAAWGSPFSAAATTATNNGAFTGLTVVGNTATNIATTATNQAAGGGGAHNNLQPYAAMNYIIRF